MLEYEVWTRIAVPVFARALEPFPLPVRTLDALHGGDLFAQLVEGGVG